MNTVASNRYIFSVVVGSVPIPGPDVVPRYSDRQALRANWFPKNEALSILLNKHPSTKALRAAGQLGRAERRRRRKRAAHKARTARTFDSAVEAVRLIAGFTRPMAEGFVSLYRKRDNAQR